MNVPPPLSTDWSFTVQPPSGWCSRRSVDMGEGYQKRRCPQNQHTWEDNECVYRVYGAMPSRASNVAKAARRSCFKRSTGVVTAAVKWVVKEQNGTPPSLSIGRLVHRVVVVVVGGQGGVYPPRLVNIYCVPDRVVVVVVGGQGGVYPPALSIFIVSLQRRIISAGSMQE